MAVQADRQVTGSQGTPTSEEAWDGPSASAPLAMLEAGLATWAWHLAVDALTVLLACVAIAWWLVSAAAVAVTERVRTRPP